MISSTERIELFKNELKLINNDNIRNAVEHQLALIPDYFFYIPASSSGKYHPAYALGEGGLLRHVKATTVIADDLFILEDNSFDDIEKDEIIAALILHDSYKAGEDTEEYDPKKPYRTVTEHPVIAANKFTESMATANILPKDITNNIANMIITHMGQWNTKYHSDETFAPKPQTKIEKFVHLCDYLASRKRLEVIIDT